jgi:hypothetical protein
MARARMVKPSFFTNERLADLEPLTRLLYVGLWTLADREGRLEDRPKRIKIEVLPYDDCDVEAMLSALSHSGFVIRYEANGVGYIQVVNFAKHQRPHANEIPSIIPECPEVSDDSAKVTSTCTKDASASLLILEPRTLNIEPRGLIETSEFQEFADDTAQAKEPIADVKQSEEDQHEKRGPYKKPIPDDFAITESMFTYAASKGLTQDRVYEETEHFVNYHHAKGTKHKDWVAAWKYWLRRAQDYARANERTSGAYNGSPLYDRHGNPTSAFFAKQAAELAADGD